MNRNSVRRTRSPMSAPRLARLGLMASIMFVASIASAQISLGTADSYSVLAGSTVTSTGATTINGNLGVSPGSAVTGFPPGVVVPPGMIHAADASAAQAQADLTTAYNAVAGTPTLVDLTGTDLGGLTLTPGVYGFASSAQLTGTLTLDAQGNPNALFLFKIGTSLTTASGSSVTVINGGTGCNVYWQVGSSATLGTGTTFLGNILALASITLNTGATLGGRALARNGAVTMEGNSVGGCAVAPVVCPIVTVNPATLPPATVGTPYAQLITAAGGTAPYTYAVSSGALPPGLTLNPATGALTGTPTSFGTYNFTITGTDANACPGSRAYVIIVAAPVCPAISMLPVALPSALLGTPWSQIITASGGVAPYTFAITSGAPPTGVSLNPTSGLMAGTPTTAGIFSFTVTATDINNCPGSRPYVLVIPVAVCPILALAPATLPMPVLGVPYNQVLLASGGTAPYTYSVSAGALPAGLALNASSGAITGMPTAAGTSSYTITATDANGCAVSVAYIVTVVPAVCPVITMSPPTLPVPVLGIFYSQTISATGDVGPYSYAITSGALPAGLILNGTTGTISGTPSAAGTYGFTVTATSASGCVALISYSLVVIPIVTAALPPADPIPTLSEWGLILLIMMMALLGCRHVVRRR